MFVTNDVVPLGFHYRLRTPLSIQTNSKKQVDAVKTPGPRPHPRDIQISGTIKLPIASAFQNGRFVANDARIRELCTPES